jgi:hypothetical protein
VRSLSLRPGNSLTTPKVALSMGFRDLVFLLSAIRATGLLAVTLAGLTPAEDTRLYWTHQTRSHSSGPHLWPRVSGTDVFGCARPTDRYLGHETWGRHGAGPVSFVPSVLQWPMSRTSLERVDVTPLTDAAGWALARTRKRSSATQPRNPSARLNAVGL